jgi:hypothetical protein
MADDDQTIRNWFSTSEADGKNAVDHFRAVVGVGADFSNVVDDARFQVSRFFVRTRKLVHAGYLNERVVIATLDRAAIESGFPSAW